MALTSMYGLFLLQAQCTKKSSLNPWARKLLRKIERRIRCSKREGKKMLWLRRKDCCWCLFMPIPLSILRYFIHYYKLPPIGYCEKKLIISCWHQFFCLTIPCTWTFCDLIDIASKVKHPDSGPTTKWNHRVIK